MRVSREKAAENRERVIDIASKLFRERGFDGVGVADLMKAAGLTHGGFYGNFASKDDLILQACSRALDESLAVLRGAVEDGGKDTLGTIAATYLSPTHRDHPGDGCALAALGAEVARNNTPVRSAFYEEHPLCGRATHKSCFDQVQTGEKRTCVGNLLQSRGCPSAITRCR